MTPSAILESALYVTDLAAAEKFYVGVLGLDLLGKVDGRHLFFRCGPGVLLIFNAEATRIPPAPDARLPVPPHGAVGEGHLCFAASADEIVAWKAHLGAKRIAIESEFEWPQGGRSLYIRDPSGNSIEFAEPRIWGL
ncbi:glyoxalase/bleomycin resistance/extradiol dioxygenase family protein [Mesorhizobium loti]|uniref:Glyoxalase/bleomycin resistance/extradiol dioxygenase family protein n=1 Tax=Mesorhizobium jarvisii TaxID=1777867 RepID=A0A6M7TAF5_9HYPH|nr:MULTISPECIES: VOC family protein [Mesorhizobium]OBQ60596.1 bleomycin resistance protein [Mesorhizobium loti]QKC61549.1 glyoxalase/bleomycin resistance/extradiol dioxygenase family protein [Mesorhizobium jarvisii]QKD07458.1 glyoxalase/bleomycin resistance/extradiol dioxygenase family protein [Mesorhizobium loti]RJT31801.1 glyoxalase/bleomycin resistance/extradiol dioxygenase family protein [Mesorhizobium jarvisii]BCG98849.1 bleomycin resistance protein [Mesorhizobium sp. 131-2-5]